MYLTNDQDNTEAKRLRRLSGTTGASCAALAALPALSLTHGHPVLGFTIIGLQVVLIAFSISFLARSKRIDAACK